MDQIASSPKFNSKAIEGQFELAETKSILSKFQSMSPTSTEYSQTNHLALYSKNDFIIMSSRTEIISIITMNSMLPPVVDIANCFRYPLRHELIKVIPDAKESKCIALFRTDTGCAVEIIPLTNIIHRAHKGPAILFEGMLIDIERIGEDDYLILDEEHRIHLLRDWKPVMTYSKKATAFKVNLKLNILLSFDQNNLNELTIYKDKEVCFSKSLNVFFKRSGLTPIILLIETFLNYLCIICADTTILFVFIASETSTLDEDSSIAFEVHPMREKRDVFSVFNEKEMLLFVFDRGCALCELFSFANCIEDSAAMNSITKVAEVDLCPGIIGAAVNNNVYVNKEQVKFILLILTEKGNLMQFNYKTNQETQRKPSVIQEQKPQEKANDKEISNGQPDDNHELNLIDSLLSSSSEVIRKIYTDISTKMTFIKEKSIKNASLISLHSMIIDESNEKLSSLKTQLDQMTQAIQREVISHSLLDNLALEPILPSPKAKYAYLCLINNLRAIRDNLLLNYSSMEANESFDKELCSNAKTASKLFAKMKMASKFNSEISQRSIAFNQNEVFVLYMKTFEQKFRQLVEIYDNRIELRYQLNKKEYDRMKGKAPRNNANTVEFPREIKRNEAEIGMMLKRIAVRRTKVNRSQCRELDAVIKENGRNWSSYNEDEHKGMCEMMRRWLEIEDRVKVILENSKKEEMITLNEIKEKLIAKELMRRQEIEKQKENTKEDSWKVDNKPTKDNQPKKEDNEKKDKGSNKEKPNMTSVVRTKEIVNNKVKEFKLDTIVEEVSFINETTNKPQEENVLHQYLPDSNPNPILSKPQTHISIPQSDHFQFSQNKQLEPFSSHFTEVPLNVMISNQHESPNAMDNNTLMLNHSFGTNHVISARHNDIQIRNESFFDTSISPSNDFPLLSAKVSPIPKITIKPHTASSNEPASLFIPLSEGHE